MEDRWGEARNYQRQTGSRASKIIVQLSGYIHKNTTHGFPSVEGPVASDSLVIG